MSGIALITSKEDFNMRKLLSGDYFNLICSMAGCNNNNNNDDLTYKKLPSDWFLILIILGSM